MIRDDDERNLTAKLKRLASLTKDRGNEQDGVTNDAERIAINNNAVEKNLSIDRSNVESNPVELNKVIEKDSSTERNDMGLNSAKFSCGLNNANFVCLCSEFELQMRRVEKDVQYLMQRVKDQELNETTPICTRSTCTCQSERKLLSDDLEAANVLIKELQMKINNLENEKSSLITAIKLIQQDNNNALDIQHNANTKSDMESDSAWTEVISKGKKKRKKRKAEKEAKSDCMEKNESPNQAAKPQTSTSSNQEHNDDVPRANNTNSTRSNVIIAGDSLVKHLKGFKMSKTGARVSVSTFSGCKTSDMADHIKPVLRKKPHKLILHVGTNSLKDHETPTSCAQEIMELAESIKSNAPNTELLVSGLITRTDDENSTRNVSRVNSELKRLCTRSKLTFIDHSNISSNELNRSKLHLNKVGTKVLASNFIKHIYNNSE